MPESKLLAGATIHQAELRKVTENRDHRGSFTEIFQDHWGTCLQEAPQWSAVKSGAGVFRGMHLHLRHDEYFTLLSGHCLVALKDVRPGSPTKGVFSLYELHEDDMAAVIFPRGLLHGWYFFRRSLHVQAVSEAYVDYHADDNHGVHWQAPDLGIPWPFTEATLSPRAQDFTTEAALLASIKEWPAFASAPAIDSPR
ncbi:MAG: dTDP-4-dehydrorhamnose 3,5-epimerase family protein [Bacteroidota bacterium]